MRQRGGIFAERLENGKIRVTMRLKWHRAAVIDIPPYQARDLGVDLIGLFAEGEYRV